MLTIGSRPEVADMNESMSDFVAATLTKLGLPIQTCIMLTMLVRDRRFAGYRFSYDGGCAVLRAGGNTLDLYDNWGKLLRTVSLGTENEQGTSVHLILRRYQESLAGQPILHQHLFKISAACLANWFTFQVSKRGDA